MNSPATTPDAIILVGGMGTRLRSVVNDVPKPLAEVCGRPFLEWLVLNLYHQGVRRIVFATGYMSEAIEQYFGDGSSWGMNIVYSKESHPLGTGGAVRAAVNAVRSDSILVLNGDSYCRFNIENLQQSLAKNRARGCMWLVEQEDCSRFGTVKLDQNGGVNHFEEKSAQCEKGLINAGIYLLRRTTIESIPAARQISLEREIFPQWMPGRLYGVVGDGPFLDIGTPDSYAEADQFIQRECSQWQDAA